MPYLSHLHINTPGSGLVEDRATVAQYPFLCLRDATVARSPPPFSFPFCVLVRQPQPTSRSLVPTLVLILSTFRPTNIRLRRRPCSLSNHQPQTDSRPQLAFRSVPQAFYLAYSTSSRTQFYFSFPNHHTSNSHVDHPSTLQQHCLGRGAQPALC